MASHSASVLPPSLYIFHLFAFGRILYNFKADSADIHWRKDLLRETALKGNPFEIRTI